MGLFDKNERKRKPGGKGGFQLDFTLIPPVFVKDETMIEFRDPTTQLGGRINFRKTAKGMLVEIDELDPGVVMTGATESPAEAGNAAFILRATIVWLKGLENVTYPSAFDNMRPHGFDGIAALEKLVQQFEQEERR